MSREIYQCVPNFSEGRRLEVVEAIANAIRETEGATLADYSADVDHNRCVMSILGRDGAIRHAVLAAARVAITHIDLRTHKGIHPRAGAIDVLPVVPLRYATREQAIALADQIGTALADELRLPVYFYEWNARPHHAGALPDLRRGGFEAFAHAPLTGGHAPDLGPDQVHPSAGVVIVGARGPLVAYNVNLATPDITVARHIARRIRHERDQCPELYGVRALGLFLASQNRAQVSLNLTRPRQTPLPAIFTFIQQEAARLGILDMEPEIIGLVPRATLLDHPCPPNQVLEHWLPEE